MKALIATSIFAATALFACPASQAAAGGDPILVGLIAGTTGAYGTTGVATVQGAQLAIAKVNAAGGVLGRPLKLEWYNDNASATLSGQLFAKLVSNGAVAIAGSPDTGPVTAQLATRYKIPTIGVVDDGGLTVNPKGPSSPPNPWVFDFGLNTFAWGAKIAQHALKNCPQGLAVLHDPSTYGEGGNYGIQLVYRKANQTVKIDQTITENWSTGATTGLMPQISAIKAAGVTCADVWLTPQDQAAFAQDKHSLGFAVTTYGNDETNADDTFANLAGDYADGTISAVLTSDLHPSPAMLAFRESYKNKFNAESTPFAETSYDSILMLAQVITKSNSTKPADLQKEFNATTNFDGITGSLSFSPENHITITPEQLTLVKYDAASKKWVELND
ncbi:ABC transporter substrate-binding protein [Acidisoma silvae]|uniref:ABC transporter substrate-binding protein n=1 Tax=Acidisoma silvae TaxID=2802396 RepID=A0A963YWD3_9PROT|nr:ABC transporter substrate-binding protein [Acidisoma silvae]MCB8878353.1 ABC transporter substrate-binding protein [Acidisoma silvae]